MSGRYLFREATGRPEDRGASPPRDRRETGPGGMIIGRATFDLRFEAATEVVGGMKLKVWMSTPDAQDMDVFVAVQKLDAYGDVTG